MRNIRPEFKNILLNKEVIDVNQDEMGIPGKRIFHNETLDIWLRPILPKIDDKLKKEPMTSFAIAFLNRRESGPIDIKVKLKELGLTSTYLFHDLFDKIDLGLINSEDKIKISIPSTGIRLLRAQIKVKNK